MSRAKELCEKRALAAAKMTEILQAVAKAGTGMTPEQRSAFDAADADQKKCKEELDLIKRSEELDAELRGAGPNNNAQIQPQGDRGFKDAEERNKRYKEAFFRALSLPRGCGLKPNGTEDKQNRGGEDSPRGMLWMGERGLNHRKVLDECLKDWAEHRDQEAGTQSLTYTQGAAGGYFVPAGFVYDVEIATKYFCPMADGSVIRIMQTATGNVLPYPTNNDTNEAWTIIGEAAPVSDNGQNPNYSTVGSAPGANPGNVAAGVINFGAWKGTTGLIRVSLELLQDSAFDLEDFLKNAFAVRLGRGYEYYLTRGTGVNQPNGILTAVVASGQPATVAAGSNPNDGSGASGAVSIGTQDLVSLEHSIDPSYRRGAKFLMHDGTLKIIKNLLDKYGRPLWVPGLAVNAPDTILGYPYVINQAMPQVAASQNTVLFGALQKFVMRKVRDLSVLRLDERFADFGEVAFVAFSRIDSQLLDAGVHPIGFLQQHS